MPKVTQLVYWDFLLPHPLLPPLRAAVGVTEVKGSDTREGRKELGGGSGAKLSRFSGQCGVGCGDASKMQGPQQFLPDFYPKSPPDPARPVRRRVTPCG